MGRLGPDPGGPADIRESPAAFVPVEPVGAPRFGEFGFLAFIHGHRVEAVPGGQHRENAALVGDGNLGGTPSLVVKRVDAEKQIEVAILVPVTEGRNQAPVGKIESSRSGFFFEMEMPRG